MGEDRVDSMLAECLDRPAGEWARCLEARCGEHPDLAEELRRRFERLRALGLLHTEREPGEGASPERLGRYRLLRRLGGGGMGVVYEALDERLGRRVALKVIRNDQLFFEGARRRFAREMQAASRLEHPNLCPIYEAGEIDGVPYITMPYVSGETLAQALDRRRRERAASGEATSRSSRAEERLAAILLVEKLARALHAAHEVGLVHRDVKPGNVLLARDGEPMLADFGLARDTQGGLSALTRTGDRVGTPAYMAPEQISGQGAVDRRSDVYALGVTLYECLTLRLPFESATREELYHRILTEPAPDPRPHHRGLEQELRVVLDRALEKDPAERFATAGELADELRRIRLGEPILSRRPSAWVRALRWSRRNRAAAAVLVATSLGLSISLWLLRESTLAQRRADRAATEFRALALLQAAGEAEAQDPELAFQYAREALRLHDDPAILAKTQEIVFQLRQRTALTERRATFVRYSPDGRFLVATTPAHPAELFRRGEGGWTEVELPDTGWRATNSLGFASAEFSPDGKELALLGLRRPGRVHRYALGEGAPTVLPSLAAHAGSEVLTLRYDPAASSSRLLVSHGPHCSVWDREGTPLADLRIPRDGGPGGERVLWADAAFLPNGDIAAVGGIWSDAFELRATLPMPHGSWVNRVLVAPTHFLTLSPENHIQAFDFDGAPLAEHVFPRRHEADWVRAFELDAEGRRLLVTFGGRVWILDAETLAPVADWGHSAERALDAHFSPDGSRIAGHDEGGGVRIWNPEGELLDALAGSGNDGWLDWSPDGRELASAAGRRASIWRFAPRPGVNAWAALGIPDVAVSPSGRLVLFASDAEGQLRLCDESGGVLAVEEVASLTQPQARFLAEDTVVVGSRFDRRLLVLEVAPGSDALRPRALELPLPVDRGPAARLADGRWLFLSQRRAYAWSERESSPELLIAGACLDFVVSCDGTRAVFAGYADRTGVTLWSAGDGPTRLPGGELTARGLALSPDDRGLLVAASDARAYLWDLDRPERPPKIFAGHQSPLVCAAFSLDGARLATASEDGSIRVWDAQSRRTRLRLRHRGIRRLAFTRRGQLLSAGSDGTLRWWWLDGEPLRQAVEAIDVPDLTEVERARAAHLLGG